MTDIKFKPVFGNVDHIRIVEVLGRLHENKERLKRVKEEYSDRDWAIKKVEDKIAQDEREASRPIDIENSKQK